MKHSSGRSEQAFAFIEVLAIVVIIMAMASVILPYFARGRGCRAAIMSCVNNQKQIGLAFRVWALDNGDKFPMQVSATNGGTMEVVEARVVFPHFEVMSNELSTPKILFCPKESQPGRKVADSFGRAAVAGSPNRVPFASDANLSYFVGVDATNGKPGMLLCGDDNFTIEGFRLRHRLVSVWTNSTVEWTAQTHAGKGNISFADGSVAQMNIAKLMQAIQQADSARSRLAMP
jgi:prepilin-type processing-associated H-X9-DG protein